MRREYPVTPGMRLWHGIELLLPGATNMCDVRMVRGPLVRGHLERAAQRLAERHDVLRCGIRRARLRSAPDDWRVVHLRCRQVVDDEVELQVESCDSLDDLAVDVPFRMSAPPLFRLRLVTVDDQCHAVGISAPHAVTDGWSQGLIWRDLEQLYLDEAGLPSEPLPAAGSYGEHAKELYDARAAGTWDEKVTAWRRRLAGGAFPALPSPRSRNPSGDERSLANVACTLDHDRRRRLDVLRSEHRVSSFVVFAAAYAISLSHLLGSDEIVVMTPFANRTRTHRNTVGCFANLVLLRFEGIADESLTRYVPRAATTVRQALSGGFVSFDAIPEAAAILTGARQMIRQAGQARQPTRWLEEPLGSSDIAPVRNYGETFDLTFDFGESAQGWMLNLTYAPARVDGDWVGSVMAELETVLATA